MLKHPAKMDWHNGPLPRVEDVFFDCVIILWSENYVGPVFPDGNDINPLRWADACGLPRWGKGSPSGVWAYWRKGSRPRPAGVVPWDEFFRRFGEETRRLVGA